MKIIKQGTDMLVRPVTFNMVCPCCGCVFEFERKDKIIGERNKVFVKCPNRTCHEMLEL